MIDDDETIGGDNEQQDKPRLKVTDRRKFDSAGNLRDEVDGAADDEAPAEQAAGDEAEPNESAAAPPAESAAAKPDESAAAGPADNAGAEPAGDSAADRPPTTGAEPAAEATTSPPGDAPSIADLPRDFSAFVDSLYFEAMFYMGMVPDPQSGQTSTDLDLAKYKIDTLAMLQDKTQGNLNEAEEAQVTEALYQLRMVFVQKTQG